MFLFGLGKFVLLVEEVLVELVVDVLVVSEEGRFAVSVVEIEGPLG